MRCRILPSQALLSAALLCAVLAIAGCGGNSDPGGADSGDAGAGSLPPSEPIRLLVVDDPPLADAIARQWQGHGGSPMDIDQQSSGEFESRHLAERKPIEADAVIYPAAMIGALAEAGLIEPLSEAALSGSQLDRPDILMLARLHEAAWGEQVYAVPFGSPQLVLMYRSDLLEQLGAKPPATWAEYQTLAEKLSDRASFAGPPSAEDEGAEGEQGAEADAAWHGTVEPLAAGWASQVLLARAAPYARRRNRYSTLFDYNHQMRPQIDQEPFVRALEELAAAAKLGPAGATGMTPHDARRELLAGRAAMAVCWPTRGIVAGQQPLSDAVRFPVRFAELPGSPEVFDVDFGWQQRTDEEDRHIPLLSVAGRLGSAVKDSPRARSAQSVLIWLARRRTAKESGRDVATASPATTLYRASQLQNAQQWVDEPLGEAAARSYAAVVRETHLRTTPLMSVRIPGRRRYLDALETAVHAALSGEQQPADALAEAAKQWSEITAQVGLEAQRSAYMRSLGLEP